MYAFSKHGARVLDLDGNMAWLETSRHEQHVPVLSKFQETMHKGIPPNAFTSQKIIGVIYLCRS
jgi:hypothetical protein